MLAAIDWLKMVKEEHCCEATEHAHTTRLLDELEYLAWENQLIPDDAE